MPSPSDQICQRISQTEFPSHLKNTDKEELILNLQDLQILGSMLVAAKEAAGLFDEKQNTFTLFGEKLTQKDNPVAYDVYLEISAVFGDDNAGKNIIRSIFKLAIGLSRRAKRKIKFPKRRTAKNLASWLKGLSSAKLKKIRLRRKKDKKTLTGLIKLTEILEAAIRQSTATVRPANVRELSKLLSSRAFLLFQGQRSTSDLCKTKTTVKAFWSGLPPARRNLIKRLIGANNASMLASMTPATKIDLQKIETLKSKITSLFKHLCRLPYIYQVSPPLVKHQPEAIKVIVSGRDFPNNPKIEFLKKDQQGKFVRDNDIELVSSIGQIATRSILEFEITVKKKATPGFRTLRISGPLTPPDLAAEFPKAFEVKPLKVEQPPPPPPPPPPKEPKKSGWLRTINFIHDDLRAKLILEGGDSTYQKIFDRLPFNARPLAETLTKPKFIGIKLKAGPTVFKPKPWFNVVLLESGLEHKGFYHAEGADSYLVNLRLGGILRFKPGASMLLDAEGSIKYRYTDLQNPILRLFYDGHNLLSAVGGAIGTIKGKYTARFAIKYLNEWTKYNEFTIYNGESRNYPYNTTHHASELGLDLNVAAAKTSPWDPELNVGASLTLGTENVPGVIMETYENTRSNLIGFKAGFDLEFPNIDWGADLTFQHFVLFGWNAVTSLDLGARVDFGPWGGYGLRGGYSHNGLVENLTVYNYPGFEHAAYIAARITPPYFSKKANFIKAVIAEYRFDIWSKLFKKGIHSGSVSLNFVELLYYLSQ